MKQREILSCSTLKLTPGQRQAYFDDGYLLVEDAIHMDWLDRLRTTAKEWEKRSRGVLEDDPRIKLAPGHSASTPRISQVRNPVDDSRDTVYWEFLNASPLTEIFVDLLGPNVKLLSSVLYFKWTEQGFEYLWHQDIPFYPHTNYSLLLAAIHLYECTADDGPLGIIPGSHDGELFDHRDDSGQWLGRLSDKDLSRTEVENARYLTAAAGAVELLNCRTIHCSKPNLKLSGRPLLDYDVCAADAFAYTPHPRPSLRAGTMLSGKPARYAHHDPRPCPIPPALSPDFMPLNQEQSS